MLQIETSQPQALPEGVQTPEQDAEVEDFYSSLGLLTCGGSVFLQEGDPWNPGSVPDRRTVRAVVQLSSVTQSVATKELGRVEPRITRKKNNPAEGHLLYINGATQRLPGEDPTKLDVVRKTHPLFDEGLIATAFSEANEAVDAAFRRSRITVVGYTKKSELPPDLIDGLVASAKAEAERPTKISEGRSFKPGTKVLGAAVFTESEEGVSAGFLITSHLLRAARLAVGTENSNLPYSHRSLGADRVINLIGSRILTAGLRPELA